MADPNPLARSPIRGPCRTIAAPCLLLALAMVLDAPGPARALQPCTPTTALQPAAGAQFGCSCATDGTAAAVGAMRDPAAAPAAGALYVLQPGGEVRLTAGDAGAGDQLGFSVAVGGGTLAGGAPFAAAPGAAHAGAVYVFSARDGSWSAASSQVKLVAPDARSGDHFGQTLALKGDRIAVGAPDRTGSGGSFSGAVYLFQRSGGGAWTLEAELADPDAAPFDGFGYSVALDGDVLAVGAPFADRPGGGGSLGAVHVFARGASGWNRVARLTAKDGADGDELGVVVALDGGTLVAGARRADVAGRVDAGAAYVFSLNGGAWNQTAELTAPAPGAGDLFGSAVAVAGPRVVVGARFHGEGAPNAGAVYVFDPIGKPPTVVLGNPPQAGAELGAAVAASGDAVIASASLADVGGAVDAGSVLACPSPLGTQPPGAAVFTITNTDGMATYRPGQPVAYTIVVTNVGTAAGTAHVTTAVAGQLRGAAWCRGAGCTPSHPGDVDDTVVLGVGESATYTVAG
ncbi:MAG TPA: FG-GAP repeat protein, partial [Thermoanaerobaculia bacterium]